MNRLSGTPPLPREATGTERCKAKLQRDLRKRQPVYRHT